MAAVTLNIGTQPDFTGALKFVGANTYGPKITIDLPRVQLAPAAALNVIGDEYGIIEIEAKVLADATGEFGTVSGIDDVQVAPNVLNYYVGTGLVSWQGEGDITYTELGNCQAFEFEQQVERLLHWEHMSGIRSNDFAPIVQQQARVRMRLDEWTAQNLRMYFLSN